MANIPIIDGAEDLKYVKATGEGTDIDPHVPVQAVTVASLPLPSGAATASKQDTEIASLATLAGAVAGTEMQVDVLTMPTTTVQGTVTATGPLTDTQLRASAVPVSGTVTATGPLTDTQLRATPVAVEDANSDNMLIALNLLANTVADEAMAVSGTVTAGVSSVALPTTIYAGQTAVTIAGTQVALASSQAILSGVLIKALHANTGWIYVGDSNVDSTHGIVLDAGESVFVEITNLATVYVDSSVNGEGVSYLAT